MEHSESLPLDLEAPPPTAIPVFTSDDDEAGEDHEVQPTVRRNSVNVASVYRSNRSLHPTHPQEDIGDASSSSSNSTDIEEVGLQHGGVKRRNSVNVASVMRSQKDIMSDQQADPGHLATLFSPLRHARQSLNVDSYTIRQHVRLQPHHEVNDDPSIMSEVPRDSLAEVQFTIPEDSHTDFVDDNNAATVPKQVTFGAYYDTHNDEIIPELRHVELATDRDEANSKSFDRRIQKLINDAPPLVQMAATFLGSTLMYAIMQSQRHQAGDLDGQILTMILVTLCGSTVPHLITAFACGVYAGSVSSATLPSYGWVILLGVITSIVWQIVSTYKLMLGFSGRLGASAFTGMNLTAIIAFGVSPSVDFTRYGNFNELWGNITFEEALVTVLACVFLASTASYFRLIATVPVNPVLVPSACALCCMILISLIDYKYNPNIFGGFAVGSYVAMAAESRLPNLKYFATVGLVAGLWIVVLQPFFLGFGGKSGFTAMVGYSTCLIVQKLNKKFFKKNKESQRYSIRDNIAINSGDDDKKSESVYAV